MYHAKQLLNFLNFYVYKILPFGRKLWSKTMHRVNKFGIQFIPMYLINRVYRSRTISDVTTIRASGPESFITFEMLETKSISVHDDLFKII